MGNPVEAGEVFISDTYFPLAGPVRRTNFAATPNPILFGDTSKAGDTAAMTQLTQVDYSGGSGIHLGNTRTDTTRFWTSDLNTRGHRALTLPDKITDLGVPTWAAATAAPRIMIPFNSQLWVSFDDKLGYYTDAGGWVGAADRTAAGSATCGINWHSLLFYGIEGGNYTSRTTAGVWVVGAFAVSTFADWDNKLWAMNASDGLLRSSIDGATWVTKAATLANPYGVVPKLSVYRDGAGATALYVHTADGLQIYDALFDRWLLSEIQYSPTSLGYRDAKIGVQGPDGRYYTTNGKLGLLALQTGNPMVITPVGLDRDDGYPAADDGVIFGLAADESFVYAQMRSETGQPLKIRGYRGGWHTFAQVSSVATSISDISWQPLVVSTIGAGGNKRLFWTQQTSGNAPKVYSIRLNEGAYNPRFFSAPGGYEAGPLTHVTPWWPFETEVQRKIFGHFFVQAKNHTATEKTTIEYGTDLDESTWTALTGAYGDANPIVSDGLKEFFVTGAGAQMKWIRFRFTQQRGGTTTLTPLIEFWRVEVMSVLSATYAYSVEIDLSGDHRGKTPEQMRQKIEDLVDPQVTSGFYKFCWQDELAAVRTHYGRLSRESGQGPTGPAYRGQGRESLTIIVPYHRDVV